MKEGIGLLWRVPGPGTGPPGRRPSKGLRRSPQSPTRSGGDPASGPEALQGEGWAAFLGRCGADLLQGAE
jgi:hypothetical protein